MLLAQPVRRNCALALSNTFSYARGSRYSERSHATVSESMIIQHAVPSPQESFVPPLIDHQVLLAARSKGRKTSLSGIIQQYLQVSGTVLDVCLPYESRPSPGRRADKEKVTKVVTVAHCSVVGDEHKITLASGFALNVDREKIGGEMAIVTCGHTLEEVGCSVPQIVMLAYLDTIKR